VSLNQYYYAKTLVWRKTNTNGDEYEVMINEKGYNCTCEFGSLWSGGSKDCCHIKSVKMMVGQYER